MTVRVRPERRAVRSRLIDRAGVLLERASQRGNIEPGVLLGQPPLGRPAPAEPAEPAVAVLGGEVGQGMQATGPSRVARLRSSSGAVSLDRFGELRDTAGRRHRGDRDHGGVGCRRASAARRGGRRGRAMATRPRSALVTTSTSGTSMIPAFRNCRTSPEPGLHDHHRGVGHVGHLGLGLADADGLDDHHVEGDGERRGGGAGGRRQTAQPVAGGGRADEHASGRRGRPRSGRGRRAATPPERREVGSTASTATERSAGSPCGDQAARAARTCRRPGGPVTPTTWPGASPPRAAGESSPSSAAVCSRAASVRRLDQIQHRRGGAEIALAQALRELAALSRR